MTTPTPYIKKAVSANWGTPAHIRARYPVEEGWFDPCPFNPTTFVDGLTIEWRETNFVNPPFGDLGRWSQKVDQEVKKGKRVTLLMPARVDTKYFHDFLLPNNPRVEYIKGRLSYVDLDNSSAKPATSPFPSILLHFNEPTCD
jgi:hypothetical protein